MIYREIVPPKAMTELNTFNMTGKLVVIIYLER